MQLTSAQLDQYRTEGFVVLRSVIDAALLDEMRAHVNWLQQHRAADLTSPELFQFQRMNDDPFWHRVVSDERLVDIAESLLGPNIALFASGYFHKRAYEGLQVGWHQDSSAWPLVPMEAAALWVAVDASTPDNGCLRVIPGSHLSGVLPVVQRHDVASVLASGIEGPVDASRAVDLVLAPGDVSVHHPSIVHGSEPNTSPNRRCGLAIRYISTSTRILVGPTETWPGAFHLRGTDPGTNRYNPRPRFQSDRHMTFSSSERWT